MDPRALPMVAAAVLAAVPVAPALHGQSPQQPATQQPAATPASGTTQEPKPPAAPAQQPPPVQPAQRLPEVIITEAQDPSRTGEIVVPIDFSAARDVIGRRDVRQSSAPNTAEVLRRSPNVFVTDETGSDSLPNITIRGLSGNEGAYRSINLTMLADGIPLAPAPYGHPGSSLFPMVRERVHAVDIQRSGGTVVYGPNNVSGIVNFLTRPIPEEATVETRFSMDSFANGSVYTGYGVTHGRFGALLEAVYKDGEGYRENGEYSIENYALKTHYDVSDDVRVLFQVEKYDDDSHLSDGLPLAAYQADPWQTLSPLNRFEGHQERANMRIEWQVDEQTLAELITWIYDGNRTFWLGSPNYYGSATPAYIQATPRPMRVAAVQPQVTHEYSVGSAKGQLVAGLRYLQEDIVRKTERYFPDGSYELRGEDQYDYYTGSAFIENTFVVGDFRITPGVRFEYVEIDARNRLTNYSVEKDYTEALPALRAAYMIEEDWSVFANAQTAFAAPQAVQIEISPDPQEVSAQYAWIYEVGTRTRTEDRLLAADLTFYLIDYSDRLEPDPDQFDVFLNSGRTRHQGVELGTGTELDEVGLDGVSARAAVSYNDSEYRNGEFEGNELPASPPWLASWGAWYRHALTGLWCGVDGYWVDEAFSDRENTVAINAAGTRGIRPAWSVWNLSVGWDQQLTDKATLDMRMVLRNAFDEDYFEIRSGRGIYPGAPQSLFFEVGFTQKF